MNVATIYDPNRRLHYCIFYKKENIIKRRLYSGLMGDNDFDRNRVINFVSLRVSHWEKMVEETSTRMFPKE